VLFIQYLYLNDAPEARRRQKKCANFYKVRPKEGANEQFFTLRLAASVKTEDWSVYSSLASSANLDIDKVA